MGGEGLTSGVAALVLASAVLHAAWNAMVKVQAERTVVFLLMHMTTAIAGGTLIVVLDLPMLPAAAWPYLGVSLLVKCVYWASIVRAYAHGDFGQVYPIMRGTAPALVAVGAFAFAGEGLAAASWCGVALVSAGIWSLAFGRSAAKDSRALVAAFLTAGSIAAYSVIDGLGVRVAGDPHAFACWMFTVEVVAIGAYCLARVGPRAIVARSRGLWPAAALGGLMSMAAYWIVLWAMARAPLGPVIALRETSVVFAALIGTLLFREPLGVARIVAACVVAAGVVLIKLGS
ncbi:MAG: EamA family transporter [Alphaproteobacteria bacterium]|nr:EamA family transporter [Alphaproteobacteria bacterium]